MESASRRLRNLSTRSKRASQSELIPQALRQRLCLGEQLLERNRAVGQLVQRPPEQASSAEGVSRSSRHENPRSPATVVGLVCSPARKLSTLRVFDIAMAQPG